MGSMIAANDITKTFHDREMVLKGISLAIEEKTFVVLLGPSGSGKSTLLNILSGLLRPTSGTVSGNGEIITSFSERQMADWKRKKTGNIFQNYLLLNNLTVRENIEAGKCPGRDALSLEYLAKLLRIENLLDKFPAQLSGGQQQRTAIARAVIKKPEILFCDEATGALDEDNSKLVVELLHEMKHTFGITVLFVTHNLQIAETADRIITIKNGWVSCDRANKNPILPKDMVWG